jgi:tetratricopeptide (TPR) repeat protein
MRDQISLTLACLLSVQSAGAQIRSSSPPKPFGPALAVESELCADGGDTLLEAGERVRLLALVTNRGSAAARDVELVVRPDGSPWGVPRAEKHELGMLAPGSSREVVVEFVVGDSVPAQQLHYHLQAYEASGRVHPSTDLHFSTAASTLPSFRFAWHLEHPEIGSIEAAVPGDTLYIVLCLQNAGGAARRLSLHLDGCSGSHPLDWADTVLTVGDLAAGDSVIHRILMAIENSVAEDSARASVMVLEERQSCSQRWVISFPLAGSAEVLLRRGSAAFQRGEIEAALEFYSQAVRRNPRHARAHLLQGLVYEYLGDTKRCVPAIQRAAELGDPTALAWLKDRQRVRPPAVKYVRIQPDPFAEAGRGAGLAVLRFEQEGGSDIAGRVYSKLATNARVRERFTLYSTASLEEQQEALGLTSLDPRSDEVRRALRAVDIRYVIYGTVAAESPLSFILRCVRTDDGKTLLERRLQESERSTALDDAVRLLAEGREPVYMKR